MVKFENFDLEHKGDFGLGFMVIYFISMARLGGVHLEAKQLTWRNPVGCAHLCLSIGWKWFGLVL